MAEKEPFNARKELDAIRAIRRAQKKRKTWGKSKLQPYLGDLLALKRETASYGDLVIWLKKTHSMKADKSTIRAYLKKAGGL